MYESRAVHTCVLVSLVPESEQRQETGVHTCACAGVHTSASSLSLTGRGAGVVDGLLDVGPSRPSKPDVGKL